MPVKSFLFKRFVKNNSAKTSKSTASFSHKNETNTLVLDFKERSSVPADIRQAKAILSDASPQCQLYLHIFKKHVLLARQSKHDDESDVEASHMGFNGISRR